MSRSAGRTRCAALVLSLALGAAACGSTSHPRRPLASRSGAIGAAPTTTGEEIRSPQARAVAPARSRRRTRPRHPPLVAVLRGAGRSGLFGWTEAVEVRGRPAIWISRVNALHEAGHTVTVMRLNQRAVTLALHAGGSEPGGSGWRYGDTISGAEQRVVLAGFNSAFRENYGAGGFMEGGRIGWPLRRGVASVVIYKDGIADIGNWRHGVPAPGRRVAAVRQNLTLLIDARRIPATVDTCIKICWGDPLHEQPIVARSGLGVSAHGSLLWAAGHDISVRALAHALLAAGAVRAMELDINPSWVVGYIYARPRRGHALEPIPLMPGQTELPAGFLEPYARDFFTVLARPS